MKVLIVNGCSWHNKGDVSIRLSMIESLRGALGSGTEISLLSMTPEIDAAHYGRYQARVLGWAVVTDFSRSKTYKVLSAAGSVTLLSLGAALFRVLRIRPGRWIGADRKKLLEAYIDADLVISSGGGFLSDNFPLAALLPNLFQLSLALLVNKPVVMYAQSIGPLKNRVFAFLTRMVINRAKVIMIREELSREWVTRLRLDRPKVHMTADAAFLMRPVDRDTARALLAKEGLDRKRPLVGMTVVKWSFPRLEEPGLKYRHYVKTIAEVADYLVEKHSVHIVFIEGVTDASGGGDRITTREVYDLVKNKDRVTVIREDYWPQELMGIMGEMDLFIGTRMHSNIFALISGVPVIAIAYGHKTHGIMGMMGLEKWVFPIETVQPDRLKSSIDELWGQREAMKGYIAGRIELMREQAARNPQIVKEFWESWPKRPTVPGKGGRDA
ncbi:MAG: polysaccharide pyruvyl transferase family protein [Dehalococcoidia bacterium]|nr:polysaccharide pyruvyl transferase family protein [Dehalococcoidia bacterium]